mgnify:FL=1
MWSIIKTVASILNCILYSFNYEQVPGIELHVAYVLDAVASELQLGDEGIEVVGDVVQVVVRTRHDVILTVTEIVARASGQRL